MSTWIGPLGRLHELKRVSTERIASAARSSFITTLGGAVKEQRGPRARRTWQIATSAAASPEGVAVLRALAHGALGPPPWTWIDPWAQVSNLLTPDASLLRAGTTGGTGLTQGGPVTADDGAFLPSSVHSDGGLVSVGRPAFGRGVPVVPGLPMTGSVYVQGASVQVRLQFQDVGAVAISQVSTTIHSPDGVGRAVLTAVAPPGAAWALLLVTAASRIAGPQATLTSGPVPWAYGDGVAGVSIDAIALDVTRAAPRIRMVGAEFTVQEVG